MKRSTLMVIIGIIMISASINLMGQEIRILVDEQMRSGYHSVVWDGRDSDGKAVQSGIYFYTLQVRDRIFTHQLTLINERIQ